MIAVTRSGTVPGIISPAILASFCSMVLAVPSMPTVEQIEELNSLEGSFETPHTKWAKPYAGGRARVLFLAQQQPDVNVRLPRPMHAGEMCSGRRAGPTETFTTGVRPWWATLLVLSDRKLSSPQLAAADHSAERGSMFELFVNIPDTQAVHAVKVRAVGPDGGDAPWFSQTEFVEDGKATIGLPIAHNEQPGKWTVTATDLYTGLTDEHSFIIK